MNSGTEIAPNRHHIIKTVKMFGINQRESRWQEASVDSERNTRRYLPEDFTIHILKNSDNGV
jgi:hypothetical protein